MMQRAAPRLRGKWLSWLLVSAGLLIFAGANAHLVYVAIRSQPDCVAHIKHIDDASGYRAAKSAC